MKINHQQCSMSFAKYISNKLKLGQIQICLYCVGNLTLVWHLNYCKTPHLEVMESLLHTFYIFNTTKKNHDHLANQYIWWKVWYLSNYVKVHLLFCLQIIAFHSLYITLVIHQIQRIVGNFIGFTPKWI